MVTSVPAPSMAGTQVGPARPGRAVLVVATVGPQTPTIENADWIRIDGACGTLEALSDHRRRHASPVLFDVPGPRTRRSGTLLTTSEFLVFAAAEGFEWVNLRGVTRGEDVERARDFLPPSTRLSVTVSSPSVLLRGLTSLCDHADAVLFARAELRRALGPYTAEDALRAAIHTAILHAAPPLISAGILPSMVRQRQPEPAEVAQLTDLVEAGVRGLVLTRETTHGPDPQGAVDVARLVAEHARQNATSTRDARPSARLAGRMSVIKDETAAPVRTNPL
jgi:hypothetical protein